MTSGPSTQLGERIKALRQSRKWRMVDVAERSGLSISTISKVEKGQMSMTYDKLIQLAAGLGIELSELFAGGPANSASAKAEAPPVTGRRATSPVEGGTYVKADWYEYWYLCPDFSHKHMIPILGRSTARSLEEFGELIRHAGQEFIFILEGEMDVYTEFYEPRRLRKGESMYFDSSMGHAYVTVSDEPCRFLTVCTSDRLSVA